MSPPAAPAAPPAGSIAASTARHRRRQRLTGLGALVVAAVIMVVIPQAGADVTTVFVLANIGFYTLAAQGLAFVYGEAGQLSVAHGTLVGISTYAVILVTSKTGWGFGWTVVIAVAFSVIAAVLIAAVAVRLRGHYFLIATVAVAGLASISAGTLDFTGKTAGLSLDVSRSDALAWLSQGQNLYYVSWALVLVGGGLLLLLRQSRFGRSLNGVRENETLARSLGINAPRLKTIAFGISGLFAGVAGILWAAGFLYVSPNDVSVNPGITFIMILLLGGSRSLFGAAVGSAVYIALPYVLGLSASALQIGTGVVVILVILLFPEGLTQMLQRGVTAATASFVRSRRAAKQELPS